MNTFRCHIKSCLLSIHAVSWDIVDRKEGSPGSQPVCGVFCLRLWWAICPCPNKTEESFPIFSPDGE